MTSETPVSVDPPSAQLQRIWIECLRSVLGQIAAFPITVEAASEEPAPAGSAVPGVGDKPPAFMIITASKGLQGDMAVSTSEAGALSLAQILVSEQLNAEVRFDEERREAYDELLRQVLGQVATGLKPVAGGEVELKPSGSASPAWAESGRLKILITGEKFAPIEVTLILSSELAKSLKNAEQPAAAPKPAGAAPASVAGPSASSSAQHTGPPVGAPTAPAPPGGRTSNLELLLDVHLDATIRFGQKNMLLREILELNPGSAVALDRQVQEPVELLVGGRVVAQGEVVIVDGNYGLRITEILTPQQRIEALGKQR